MCKVMWASLEPCMTSYAAAQTTGLGPGGYFRRDAVGAWPEFRAGAFRNVDLVAGFLAGIALLCSLALAGRRADGG